MSSILHTGTPRKKLRQTATGDHQSPQAAHPDKGVCSTLPLSSCLSPNIKHEARLPLLLALLDLGLLTLHEQRENSRSSLSERHLASQTEVRGGQSACRQAHRQGPSGSQWMHSRSAASGRTGSQATAPSKTVPASEPSSEKSVGLCSKATAFTPKPPE